MASATREPTRTFVERWERSAPLTDAQRRGFLELQAACAELPAHKEFEDNEAELLLEPITPTLGSAFPGRRPSKFGENDVFATSGAKDDQSTAQHVDIPSSQNSNILGTTLKAMTFSAAVVEKVPPPPAQETLSKPCTPSSTELQEPVESTQQFFDWFSRIEEEMEKGQEDVYRAYLGAMFLYRDACDELIVEIDGMSQQFQHMNDNFRFVEGKTRALQTACESLLAEQTRLVSVADAMASKLAYFNELDTIMKLFNSPGEDVCLRDEFIPMLKKLDECLSYMERNVHYRDAELYLMRFRQCMTRGMTLIKMHVVQTLRDTATDVHQRLANRSSDGINLVSQTTLFYVKFRAVAAKLKSLINEMEKRRPAHTEYNALLNDCYNAYFGARLQLLNQVVYAHILELSSSDLLMLARSGCAYLKTFCTDEYALFYQFFSTGDEAVYGYLEKFGGTLHDFLRPKIIRETKPEVLSELCGTLIEHVEFDDETLGNPQDTDGSPVATFDFGYLVRVILQDAQQKLVFRVLSYIKTDIEKYTPPPANVNVTEKMKELNAVPSSPSSNSGATPIAGRSEVSHPPNDAELPDATASYHEWYPTLERTLHVLGLLFRHVNDAVFEDISKDVVSICCSSLVSASETISAKQGKSDARLFLIKHLLILKEHIAQFAIDPTSVQKLLDSATADAPLPAPAGEVPKVAA